MLDKFKFDDHIGGIASNGVDRLYLQIGTLYISMSSI